jgi:hypothetical protein
MTTDRRPSDEQPPHDEDDLFVVDDGNDALDDAFSAVEKEVAGAQQVPPAPAPHQEVASSEPSRPHAPADDFAIDDVDDVFVIADDGEDWLTAPETRAAPDFLAAGVAMPEPTAESMPIPTAPAHPSPLVAASAAAAADARLEITPSAADPANEDDALFAAPPTVTPSESFIRSDVFTDTTPSRRGWGGHEMPPDDIGISAFDDAASDEPESGAFGWEESVSEELEIVDGGSASSAEDLGGDAADGSASEFGSEFPAEAQLEVEDEPAQATFSAEGEPTDDQAEDGEGFAVARDSAQQFGIAPIEEEDVSAPASGVWSGSESSIQRARGQEAFAAEGSDDDSALRDAAPAEFEDEVETEEVDPIYGEVPADEGEAAAAEAAEPDYSEYEENYVASAQQQTPVVVGAPIGRRRRRGFAVFAMAALAIAGVGTGLVFMNPEWLNLRRDEPLVDKVAVTRPNIEFNIKPPVVADPDPNSPTDPVVQNPPGDQGGDPLAPIDVKPADPKPADPTPGDPKPSDPVNTDPTRPNPIPDPIPDPVADPVTQPPVDSKPPVDVKPPVVIPPGDVAPVKPETAPGELVVKPDEPVPVTSDPVTTVIDPTEQIVRIGEDLQVGQVEAPAARQRVHHLADGLATGSQTFAQLKNMNFFLGRVKAMDSSFLTLDLTPGEITLAFDDLNALVPLASEEYREMQGAADGYVRLRNRNRLFGKVLNNSLADNVVLEVQKSQVVIPRATVEEVASSGRSGVHVPQDENADWIKAILQREAQQKPAPSVKAPDRPATPPTPTPPTPTGK